MRHVCLSGSRQSQSGQWSSHSAVKIDSVNFDLSLSVCQSVNPSSHHVVSCSKSVSLSVSESVSESTSSSGG